MRVKSLKYSLFLCSLMSVYPAFAEKGIMPSSAFYGLVIGASILGILIALILSKFLRSILQKLRKEERQHIWYMTLSTLILPVFYSYTVEKLYLLNGLENHFGYEMMQILSPILLLSTIIIGFLIGYFSTPKVIDK